ncbi:MAG: peptidoglycan recognition family protein [Clostridiales bacterium]|nr:peptidoglycan recognition family protein [Clostridiales bacterium]
MSGRKRKRVTKNQHKSRIRFLTAVGTAVIIGTVLIGGFCMIAGHIFHREPAEVFGALAATKKVEKPEITEELLTPNPYSRPQLELQKVKGVVVHYTANPGTDAEDNRNYFEGLKDSHKTYASSHFIIGLDGTIIQCIPLDEQAYASNKRNVDTISIECCHEEKNGKFNEQTYDSLVRLAAWLCGTYNLKEEGIIRHYDVTGKDCPRYFVKHEKKWTAFKDDVFVYIDEHAIHDENEDTGEKP